MKACDDPDDPDNELEKTYKSEKFNQACIANTYGEVPELLRDLCNNTHDLRKAHNAGVLGSMAASPKA